MLRGTSYEPQSYMYLFEVHAFANEMLINCTSAEVIENLYNKSILSLWIFSQSCDLSVIILSCLQNSRKSHESIIRGFGRG